jgi:predicted RNase H-like HicB family nuclease
MDREARTHALEVVVEPEEGAWHAWCPTLLDYGAATWGATREEALGHIREVVAMVVGRLAEAGAPVPAAPDATGAPDESGRGAPDESGRGATAERVVVTVGVPLG